MIRSSLKLVLCSAVVLAGAGLVACNNPNPEKTRTAAEMPDTSAAGGRGVAPDTGSPTVTYTRPNAFKETPSSPTVTATVPRDRVKETPQAKGAASGGAQPTPPG